MKVNNISLKQEGGQATEQVGAQPQQESVNPAIKQISDFISQAISQGQNPAEVVMSLIQQQVDQQTIGQALMMNGFEENDIMSLFEQMSQGQQPEEGAGGEPDTIGELNRSPEQLTEDERMHADDMSVKETDEPGMSLAKSGIEIKPENEGKFTRWAQARGMSVQEAANKVMSNTDEYPTAVVKMANFAKNAAGWKHEYGGEKYDMGGVPQGKVGAVNNVNIKKDMNWQKAPLYINPMAYEYSNDNFSLGKAGAVLYGGYKEFLSGDDANKDGVKDGFFRDAAKKAGIRDANKGNYYNYKITQDANDPNKYVADNTDLYNASRNKGSLRTFDQYGKDVLNNSRFNYNVDTNKYDVIGSSRPIDERIYNSANNKNALAGKDLNYLKQMIGDKDTREMLLGSLDDPEQGLLSIDQYGQASSMRPGIVNPNEYNTYMGINKLGVNQKSMIPTRNNGQPIPGMINEPAIPSIPGFVEGMGLVQPDSEFKYGGNLDKAQFGIPDLNNFFKSMGQTNYALDTQAVADAQLGKQKQQSFGTQNFASEEDGSDDDSTWGDFNDPNAKNPNIDYNKLNNFSIGPGVNDNASLSYGDPYAKDGVNFEMPTETIMTPTDQYSNSVTPKPGFGQPKVERTNKFEGGLNRFIDSPGVQGYGKLSNFAVKGAGVINDYFRDRNIDKAKADNFNKLTADYQYATAEDPFNKRGMWDVNTGTAGSEGDRTTGLYMSKYGGENNTVNVDSDLLAKLIAAGADIEIL